MVIRPCILLDRSKILHILEATKAFTNTEIRVALEVFDDALTLKGWGKGLRGFLCHGKQPG